MGGGTSQAPRWCEDEGGAEEEGVEAEGVEEGGVEEGCSVLLGWVDAPVVVGLD